MEQVDLKLAPMKIKNVRLFLIKIRLEDFQTFKNGTIIDFENPQIMSDFRSKVKIRREILSNKILT